VHANPIVKFLGLWLAGAAVFAVSFGLGAGRSAWNFYRLSHDGVLTQGTVIGLEPENHNTVRYTYKVNGQTYARADQGSAASPLIKRCQSTTFLSSLTSRAWAIPIRC
jgi:hypothetical protein